MSNSGQNGADPLLPNEERKSAFEIAAASEYPEQFKLLLIGGNADFDAPYYHGQTLLHLAVQKGTLNHVLILLKLGASLDCKDFMGCTPLHWAVKEDRVEMTRLLFSLGAGLFPKNRI